MSASPQPSSLAQPGGSAHLLAKPAPPPAPLYDREQLEPLLHWENWQQAAREPRWGQMAGASWQRVTLAYARALEQLHGLWLQLVRLWPVVLAALHVGAQRLGETAAGAADGRLQAAAAQQLPVLARQLSDAAGLHRLKDLSAANPQQLMQELGRWVQVARWGWGVQAPVVAPPVQAPTSLSAHVARRPHITLGPFILRSAHRNLIIALPIADSPAYRSCRQCKRQQNWLNLPSKQRRSCSAHSASCWAAAAPPSRPLAWPCLPRLRWLAWGVQAAWQAWLRAVAAGWTRRR